MQLLYYLLYLIEIDIMNVLGEVREACVVISNPYSYPAATPNCSAVVHTIAKLWIHEHYVHDL